MIIFVRYDLGACQTLSVYNARFAIFSIQFKQTDYFISNWFCKVGAHLISSKSIFQLITLVWHRKLRLHNIRKHMLICMICLHDFILVSTVAVVRKHCGGHILIGITLISRYSSRCSHNLYLKARIIVENATDHAYVSFSQFYYTT